jgi:hypothetical protein
MARAAICRSDLVIAGKRLRVLEVEFYLYRDGHEDPFVHCHEKQLTRGEWYFHREKSARIGFTLKGLDLSFGDGEQTYGGMLIRAIANAEGRGGYIEGPSKTVDMILGAAGVESVTNLRTVAAFSDHAFAAGGLLRFEDRAAPGGDEAIFAGPRIGLKGTDVFAKAPYRYRARPALTKKDRAAIMQGRQVPPANAAGVAEPPPAVATTAAAGAPLSDAEVDDLLGL